MENKIAVEDSIAVKYRPRKLSDIVGNKTNIDVISGFFLKKKLVKTWLLSGDSGSGKCVIGSTLIPTEEGLKPIKDIVGDIDGFEEKTLKILTKDGIKETSHIFSKESNTIRIKTELGYELEGTPEHPVLVLTKNLKHIWKPLSDIKKEDVICIERKNNLFTNNRYKITFVYRYAEESKNITLPSGINKELARFMGYIIANGGFTASYEKGFSFTTNNEVIQEDFINLCKNLFNINTKFSNSDKADVCRVNSVTLIEYLKILGVKMVLSRDKEIPFSILQSPKEIIVQYLIGYFSCNSYIPETGDIGLCTASKIMCKQLHILLLQFGIIGKRITKKGFASNTVNKTVGNYYIFIKNDNKDIFFNTFKLKKEITKPIYQYTDGIPYICNKLRKELKEKEVGSGFYRINDSSSDTIIKFQKVKNGHIVNNREELMSCNYVRNLNINSLKYVIPEIIDDLLEIINHNYYYDKVILKQRKDELQQVYDLTIPEGSNFIGNGIVIHNTTSARMIAMTVNCQNLQGIDPCMECNSCKAAIANSHPDIHELNCSGESGNVEELRKILDYARLSPRFNYRVFILDEVHGMSSKGKQEILKPLEEPPAKTIWILCTTEPEKLAEATYGRCLKLFFTYPVVDEVVAMLKRIAKKEFELQIYKALKPFLQLIVEGVGCQPRNSISTLELVASALQNNPEADKVEVKSIVRKYLLNSGAIDGLAIKFLLHIACGKKLEPLRIASKLEDPRVNEFLNLVYRYSHYSIMYYLSKQEGTKPEKEGFYGLSFIRIEQALEKIEGMTNDAMFFKLCSSITTALEKTRTGVIPVKHAVIYAMNNFLQGT